MKHDAEEAFKYNTANWKNPSGPGRKELDPYVVSCAPPGVPRAWLINLPIEIIQKPNRIIVLYDADHTFREIWLGGRTPTISARTGLDTPPASGKATRWLST